MRTPLVIGNWKMHGTQAMARELAQAVRDGLKRPRGVEVVVCPPYTALPAAAEVLKGAAVGLGAQNCHWEDQGAFTGEIAPAMLRELGCDFVILGHSERRQFFGETDELINRKAHAALAHQLTPIVCVGETKQERDQGKAEEVVVQQLRGSLLNLKPEQLLGVVIAYEPVWAIGTGDTATPADAQAMHATIRRTLAELSDQAHTTIKVA